MSFVKLTLLTVPTLVAVGSALFAGKVAATEREFAVSIHVSARGLNLSQPAAAQKLYARLAQAAHVACMDGNLVGLEPVPDPEKCSEQALADAIRSVNAPLLTQIYLETHTLRQARVFGVSVPTVVAAK